MGVGLCALAADCMGIRFADDGRVALVAIGFSLSALRNGAITLIRKAGFRCIPDARRFLPAHPELGLHLLFDP